MIRSIFVAIGAVIAGSLAIGAVQYLNYQVNPPPPGMNPNNPDDIARMMDQIPLLAKLGAELSYLVGSAVAGFLVGSFVERRVTAVALVVGVVFTGFNFMNLSSIPHPLWMAVLTTVTFIPIVWLSARFVAGRKVEA